jgi:hypothetical protein
MYVHTCVSDLRPPSGGDCTIGISRNDNKGNDAEP